MERLSEAFWAESEPGPVFDEALTPRLVVASAILGGIAMVVVIGGKGRVA